MHRRKTLCALIAAAGFCALPSYVVSAESTDAAARDLSVLSPLLGSWRLEAPQNERAKAFRISYRWISGESALVETFGIPDGAVTETIYHLDGERLMATHYCGQGNQPRLVLQPGERDGELVFEFLDATNLPDPDASHLVRMRFALNGSDRFVKEEIYAEAGKETVTRLEMRRAGEAPGAG